MSDNGTLDLKAIRKRWYGSKADDGVAITALVDEVERLRAERYALALALFPMGPLQTIGLAPGSIPVIIALRDRVIAEHQPSLDGSP